MFYFSIWSLAVIPDTHLPHPWNFLHDRSFFCFCQVAFCGILGRVAHQKDQIVVRSLQYRLLQREIMLATDHACVRKLW